MNMKEKLEKLKMEEMKLLCFFIEENCPNPMTTFFSYGKNAIRIETKASDIECRRCNTNEDAVYSYKIIFDNGISSETSFHNSLMTAAQRILEILEAETN